MLTRCAINCTLQKKQYTLVLRGMDKPDSKKTIVAINILTNIAYIVGCLSLYVISISIIATAIFGIYSEIGNKEFTVYKLLDEVGFIVFSIAVIDVCKYLMIEEVLKMGKSRLPEEERRTFTKFVVIIVTAISLEGLVLTIEAVKKDFRLLIYPVTLFLTATIFVMGLGVYQYLNSRSESMNSKRKDQ
jgi:hypothetical protein